MAFISTRDGKGSTSKCVGRMVSVTITESDVENWLRLKRFQNNKKAYSGVLNHFDRNLEKTFRRSFEQIVNDFFAD